MKLRKTIQNSVKLLGYDIHKIKDKNDIHLYYKIFQKESVDNRRFYNIGAGSFRHPAWTNVDKQSDWYKADQGNAIGISWDLLELTPVEVEDNAAEIVYSSHTLEHITDQAAFNMLKESHRILKPDGFIRITVPNIDMHFRAYKNNDRDYFYWIGMYSKPEEMNRINIIKPMNQTSIQQLFLWTFATNTSTLQVQGDQNKITDEQVDRIFREKDYKDALDFCISKCSLDTQKKLPGNHINWWNKDKLFQMLKDVGFENVRLSGYGQSYSPVLRNILFFDNTHPKISLYIEANK